MSSVRNWHGSQLATPDSSAEDAAKRILLAGDSELAQLMRAHDWARTSLGPVAGWPQSLRTCVSLILNSQHPMWVGWGHDAACLYNDAYIQVLSAAKHPWALGRPAAEVWAEIWDICGPLAAKVFERGEPTFVDEVRLFMSRGEFLEETYYSFSYSAIRDESGQVVGLFCPSAEVTARVLNARRLRTLSELSSSAFIERTVEDSCTSAARTLAKNPDDIPFSLLYLVSPESRELELKAWTRIRDDVAAHVSFFGELSQSDNELARLIPEVLQRGEPHVISLAAIDGLPLGPADQPVKQAIILPVNSRADDRALGILIAGINPTRQLDSEYRTFYELVSGHVATAIANARAYDEERRRAEALAELDRAKTTFYSNVSHEFRTPLTLMLGPLEELLAKADGAAPAEDLRLVEVAHRNGTRLLKLVNTLLDFSRIEAGRMNVTFQPVDLVAFTGELASLFRSATDRAGLRLELIADVLPQPVYVNREMWEKIVLNLLSNAFKFTFDGGITIALRDRHDGVELTVRDTGVGIPAHELPRVFDRFHRVEGTRGRSFEGSGIGLSLVQELVKIHGGTIAAESTIGEGTSFHVCLPYGNQHLPANRLAPDAAAASPRAIAGPYVAEALSWLSPHAGEPAAAPIAEMLSPTAPAGQSMPSLLLADDNPDMRDYIERLLGDRYRLRCAATGKRALELALADPPNLVLTDVMMPEMDGFELLAALRANPSTSTVPIIMLSARAGEEARIEGLQQGADDYLVKPFSARELLARVENNLRLAKLRRQSEEALLRSEKLASVGRMAATIAHEINNPLEAITNTLFLALHAPDLPDPVREYLELADSELRRVAHITRQALGFYRESNAPTRISINRVMESTLDLLKNRIRTRNVQLETQWDGDIRADAIAGELRQVFSNLLSNSLDAVDDHGAIKVRITAIRSGNPAVRVTIADNGKGIPAEFRQRIFEPFFTTKGDIGTGLGLWVTRQIVEKHGGSIRVHSCVSGDRRGTSFSIVLPAAAAN